jgi:hypothetical protein
VYEARVSYAHALGTPRVAQLEERRREGLEVPTIVTAACDRIMLLNPISIDRDLKLRGASFLLQLAHRPDEARQ